MAHIDDLMDATSSKFHLTLLAAKRAREINAYYQQLGEGTGRLVPPLVQTESNKPLTIALEEIAEGKVEEGELVEMVADDPLAFIEGDDVLSLVEMDPDQEVAEGSDEQVAADSDEQVTTDPDEVATDPDQQGADGESDQQSGSDDTGA